MNDISTSNLPQLCCDACNKVATLAHVCAGFIVCCECFATQAGAYEEQIASLNKTLKLWGKALFRIMCMGNDPGKNCLQAAVGVAEHAYKTVSQPERIMYAHLDLIYRLRTRAEIRRQIATRKSVQEGKPDRLADLLEEAATALEDQQ